MEKLSNIMKQNNMDTYVPTCITGINTFNTANPEGSATQNEMAHNDESLSFER
ncbi:hypothetical protein VEE46_16960 [Escherichia coli]|nr:hypothetical protein VEE46_16960 [Escherichia coli]